MQRWFAEIISMCVCYGYVVYIFMFKTKSTTLHKSEATQQHTCFDQVSQYGYVYLSVESGWISWMIEVRGGTRDATDDFF